MKWRAAWTFLLLGFNLAEPTLRNDFYYKVPSVVNAGDVLIVPGDRRVAAVYLAGRRLTYLPEKKVWLGVAPRQPVPLVIALADVFGKGYVEFPLRIRQEPNATAPVLRLPASVWQKVSEKFSAERTRDREKLAQAMASVDGQLPLACWQTPLSSRITSEFGSGRRLPNGDGYNHSGEDRRARIGTPIRAAGPGQVVLSESMIVPGTNIVISHGDGWYSRYLHLSEPLALVGAIVTTGQVIAKSGATGRVEAPHLHWEIVWQGIPANPSQFLSVFDQLCGKI